MRRSSYSTLHLSQLWNTPLVGKVAEAQVNSMDPDSSLWFDICYFIYWCQREKASPSDRGQTVEGGTVLSSRRIITGSVGRALQHSRRIPATYKVTLVLTKDIARTFKLNANYRTSTSIVHYCATELPPALLPFPQRKIRSAYFTAVP